MNFEKGTRVVVNGTYGGSILKGVTGTVVADRFTLSVVKLDKAVDTLFEKRVSRITVNNYSLKALDEKDDTNSIIVYHDGKETTALLKNKTRVIKSAKAACHPDDVFSLREGAKIAIDRLYGIEPMSGDKSKDDTAKKSEVREVSRVAEVGEYIKIVSDIRVHTPIIKIGAVHKVIKKVENFIDVEKGNRFYNTYAPKEYVVLEGYDPGSKTKCELDDVKTPETLEVFTKKDFNWKAFCDKLVQVRCESAGDAYDFIKEYKKNCDPSNLNLSKDWIANETFPVYLKYAFPRMIQYTKNASILHKVVTYKAEALPLSQYSNEDLLEEIKIRMKTEKAK